ncbi:hypothetical protein [Mycoplasmopsis pullorum]|uniref:Uncharacterized protein n=1 Tax=Mycoplasmopsis pullorum TaxID=48003 RepID=A0A1L4FRC4_9BACT|nr:hypothetical protein [Mycoplasmopsis pullorum]APJ38152.1 hypothetical protein BLA55_00380 [Mycoplasmopsis pullorum]
MKTTNITNMLNTNKKYLIYVEILNTFLLLFILLTIFLKAFLLKLEPKFGEISSKPIDPFYTFDGDLYLIIGYKQYNFLSTFLYTGIFWIFIFRIILLSKQFKNMTFKNPKSWFLLIPFLDLIYLHKIDFPIETNNRTSNNSEIKKITFSLLLFSILLIVVVYFSIYPTYSPWYRMDEADFSYYLKSRSLFLSYWSFTPSIISIDTRIAIFQYQCFIILWSLIYLSVFILINCQFNPKNLNNY